MPSRAWSAVKRLWPLFVVLVVVLLTVPWEGHSCNGWARTEDGFARATGLAAALTEHLGRCGYRQADAVAGTVVTFPRKTACLRVRLPPRQEELAAVRAVVAEWCEAKENVYLAGVGQGSTREWREAGANRDKIGVWLMVRDSDG